MLGHAWLVTALNPKSITFFVAFLPAFLDPHADFLTQMLVFETTFLRAGLRQCLRLRAGRHPRPRLGPNPRAIGIINRIGGSLLIGAGAATVTVAAIAKLSLDVAPKPIVLSQEGVAQRR